LSGSRHGLLPVVGAVAGPAVDEHAAHGDPGLDGPVLGAVPEPGRGGTLLAGQDPGVGGMGVIVDGGVEVPVADHQVTVVSSGGGTAQDRTRGGAVEARATSCGSSVIDTGARSRFSMSSSSVSAATLPTSTVGIRTVVSDGTRCSVNGMSL